MNDWFTVNVVKDVTPKVKGLWNWREPIKSRERENSERKDVNRVLTVHAPMQTSKDSQKIANPQNSDIMAFNSEKPVPKISDVYIQANAEADRIMQKVKGLVQNKNNAVIARLPPPWRDKFNSFSVSDNGLLYMDNRLVIPKNMRENVLYSLRTCGTRRYAKRSGGLMVASSSKRGCGKSKTLPAMPTSR